MARTASCRAPGCRRRRRPRRAETGELQRRGRLDGGRNGFGLVDGPDPGPPADHADVDEDRQRPPPAREPRRHPLDAGDRVGEDEQLGPVPIEDAADPVEPGVVDDLVGDEDPRDPRVERAPRPAMDARP